MTSSSPASNGEGPVADGSDFTQDQLARMLQAFQAGEENERQPTLAPVPPVVAVESEPAVNASSTPQVAAVNAFAHAFPNSSRPSAQRTQPAISTSADQPIHGSKRHGASAGAEQSSSEVDEESLARIRTLRARIARAQDALKERDVADADLPTKPTRFDMKWEKTLRRSRKSPAILCDHIAELGELADPRSVRMLKPLAHSRLKRVRFETAKALRGIGSPESQFVLLSLLKDPKPEVARAAMPGIVGRLDETTLPCLLAYGVIDATTRAAASREIEKAATEAIRDLLFAEAQRDESETGLFALQVAGRLQGAKTISRLTPFTKHPVAEFRRVAIDCLIATENQQVVRFLNVAVHDPDEHVRARAAGGLSRWTSKSSARRLVGLLRDPSVLVRRNAAAAVRHVARPEFSVDILACFETERDPMTLASLMEAVALAGLKDVAGSLHSFTQSANAELRLSALAALARLKDRRAMPALIRMLDDADPQVRLKSIAALGQKGNVSVLDRLERVLTKERDVSQRAAAARAIGRIASSGSIPALQDAMDDEALVRCQAVIALGEIGGSRSRLTLIERLKDSAPEVRYNAVRALSSMKDAGCVSALRRIIEDPDKMVRRAVHKTLTEFGTSVPAGLRKRRLARLTSTFSDRRPSVTAAILSLLALVCLGGGTTYLVAPKALGLGGAPTPVVRNVLQVLISPNGENLAVLRERGVFDLWSMKTGELLGRVTSVRTLGGIVFTSDSSSLLLLGSGREARWDLNPAHEPTEGSHSYKMMQKLVAANSDHSLVLTTAAGGGYGLMWNAHREPAPYPLPAIYSRATAISSDGTLVVGVSPKSEVGLLDAKTAKQIAAFKLRFPHRARTSVTSVAFSPSGQEIAVGLDHGEVSGIDLESGEMSILIEQGERVTGLLWTEDGLIATHSSQITFLTTAGDVTAMKELPIHDINRFSLSTDGQSLALASTESRDLVIVDVASRTVRHTIKAP